MTIDEEIKRFFLEYHIREKIMPYSSLPEYLQKIQYYIILIHTDLDIDMLVRILSQIRYEAGDDLNNKVWNKINLLIQTSLEKLSYVAKVSTIEDYGDVSEVLIKSLMTVNRYRNEFAHPKVDVLLKKYDMKTSQGKIKIRNLVRTLKRARNLFLDYTKKSKACKFYIKKTT
ncbi:MAG: hypothetical protein Q8P26_00895 [Candidatus Levybacteria bacterium]|nr:hypothetical protein [Candidatus Levybacteria bacterium]